MFAASDLPAVEARFWKHVSKTADCWIWTGSLTHGYGAFKFHKSYRAHRVAFELANGAFDESLSVLHKCDNPRCVRPDHLFLGTQADNIRDMLEKGRGGHGIGGLLGSMNFSAKLTEQTVREIRQGYQFRRVTAQMLAEKYSVNTKTIQRVVNRLSWKHI